MRDRPADVALPDPRRRRPRFDGGDRSYLEAIGTGATGKEAALYDLLRREMGARRSARVVGCASRGSPGVCIHPRQSTPSRVGRRHLPCRSRHRRRAMDALAFVAYARGLDGDGGTGGGGGPPEGASHVVGAEPDVERLGRSRPAARPEAPRHLRSGYGQAAERGSSRHAMPPRLSSRWPTSFARTGDAARGKDGFARCMMCHAHWRRRRRGRSCARRLDARQVAGRHRHGDHRSRRGHRPRLCGHDDPDDRRADDPGPAHQGRRPADDAQHGQRDADDPGVSRQGPRATRRDR